MELGQPYFLSSLPIAGAVNTNASIDRIERERDDARASSNVTHARLLKCEAALVDLISGVEKHTGRCNTEQLSECDLCRTLINAKKALKI
jgi:hypothetical protein